MRKMLHQDFFRPGNPLVALNRMEPQDETPIHHHEFTEIVLITSGGGVHLTEAGETRLSARTMFIVKRGQSHAYRDLNDLHLINLMYREDLLGMEKTDVVSLPGYHALFRIDPQMAGGSERIHLKVNDAHWRMILSQVETIEAELQAGEGGCSIYTQALLMQVIVEASRAYSSMRLMDGSPTARLAELFSFIEENLHTRLTTSLLADQANMSLSTLQRHFRALTGETMTAYINRLRVERAEVLLRQTTLPVTRIAFLVGFEDSNYFGKVYRHLRGISPRQVRARQ